MGYRITISWEAEDQLKALPVREQRILEAAVLARLRDHPAQPTRAIKRLRPILWRNSNSALATFGSCIM